MFFKPVKTDYDGVFVKPLTVADSLEIQNINDDFGLFVLSRTICDETGKTLFSSVNELKNELPAIWLEKLTKQALIINEIDIDEDTGTEKN